MNGSPSGKLDRRDIASRFGQLLWLALMFGAAHTLEFLANELGADDWATDLGQWRAPIVFGLVWLSGMVKSYFDDNQGPPSRTRLRKKGL